MGSLKAEARTVLYGILFLFFFQLMADFIEAIYAFGLMGTSIPVEMVSLVAMFSPLVLLAFPRRFPGWALSVLGLGVLASRAIETALDTRGRLLVSGFGVGCFLAFLPALLSAGEYQRPRASTLGAGLTLSLGLSVLLRVLGSGYDLSLYGPYQAIGWGLAVVAGILLFVPGQMPAEDIESDNGERAGTGRTIGLSMGLSSAWVLLYLGFTAPNVIARWTGASYALVVALVVSVLCALAFFATRLGRPSAPLTPKQGIGMPCYDPVKILCGSLGGPYALLRPKVILAWNALFAIALLCTILAHQIAFPPGPDAYPLFAPPVTFLHRVPLWLALILFPVILIDWTLFAHELVRARQTPRVLGASFALSSLLLLVVILGQAFTTVYDYVPVVGPFFRDKFWLVYLVPCVVLTLSTMLVWRAGYRDPHLHLRAVQVSKEHLGMPIAAMAAIGLATLAGLALTAPHPAAPPDGRAGLRVCTYNIQQGYDAYGRKNHAGQLEVLRRVDADVIGLQESDTNRAAGGNADIVRYFADKLNMHSYYGPKTVPGTFGIALLSRYPIEKARTFYMYSVGEQTATIEAQIRVGDRTFNVFVTHLGNDGPIVQQEAIMSEVAGKESIILVGDFNFEPNTAQYRLTTTLLDDAWLLRWPQGVDEEGRRFDDRIDHVFVSPGLTVGEARYITDPESDHPALVVEVD